MIQVQIDSREYVGNFLSANQRDHPESQRVGAFPASFSRRLVWLGRRAVSASSDQTLTGQRGDHNCLRSPVHRRRWASALLIGLSDDISLE